MSSPALEYFEKVRGDKTYILAESLDDRKRLVIQAKLHTPSFLRIIETAIDKFGLRAKLQDPDANVRILDLGCGEGLFVPILTNWLAAQGTKAKVSIVGLDCDSNAIATAQDYVTVLGLHNVEFYTHDLNQPLTNLAVLGLGDPTKHFDLAYASLVLMHLRNVGQILNNINEALKPGGILYTRDISIVKGFEYPSPTFSKMQEISLPFWLKLVGQDFAPQQQKFLSEANFSHAQTFEDILPIGGKTEPGRRMLENVLIGQHIFRATAAKLGIMTNEEFDAAMQQEFREITPELEGHMDLVSTIAQKPE